MSGNLSVPNAFATASGNVPASQLDTNWATQNAYINAREVTVGLIGARPVAGTSGRWYLATDVGGGTLYVDNGTAWVQAAVGVTGAAAPLANYLYNSSFDIWDDFGGLPGFIVGWGLTGAGGTAVRNTTNIITNGIWPEFSTGIAISITRAGTDVRLDQGIQGLQGFKTAAAWGSKTVTFGCWVRCASATVARISINDGATRTYSSYHSGSGGYEFLTVSVTLPAVPSAVEAACHVDNTNTSAQFDAAIFAEASALTDSSPSSWVGRTSVQVVGSNTAGANPAAGATTYLYPMGHLAAEVGWVVGYRCALKNLRVKASAAPGAGEYYQYAMRVNGASTTVAAVIAGTATTAFNSTSLVEVTVSSSIAVELHLSTAASSNFHIVSYELVEIA